MDPSLGEPGGPQAWRYRHLPFLGRGKRGSVRWVTRPGSLLWDADLGCELWSADSETSYFPSRPTTALPWTGCGPRLSCRSLLTQGRPWRLQGGGIKDPGWNLPAKSLLNSWLTETVWDNKYLLLFKKWDRHRGRLKGVLRMKMIWDKEMQKVKGSKKCTHMTKYKTTYCQKQYL